MKENNKIISIINNININNQQPRKQPSYYKQPAINNQATSNSLATNIS